MLSLDDDIREHIPELPEFEETITVRHLITHTSGLREFLNLLAMGGRRLDHGDWIDRSEIIDIVRRQPALQNAPGAEWNYNNSAFGLAAVIVERTSGQDFHVFLQENVFGPLGMTRTMVRPSPEHIVPGMSEGYVPGADGFRQIGDLGGAVGAGGIYSTVEDLQTWVQNYASPIVGSAEIFDQMMTSYVLTNGDETGYGYGLAINEQGGLRAVHHGGADVGHRSMLVYYPEISAGITVQSNHRGFDSNIAFQLAAAYFADAMENEDDEAEEPGEGTFSLALVEESVVFRDKEVGEVDRLTLRRNGQDPRTRLDDDEAAPWEPTAEDLADFEGRYFSGELETFYTLALEDEALVVHHRRRDDANLTPGAQDAFTGGGLIYSFERRRNGDVIGFYVANGRTRDVRFARVR